MNRLMSRHFIFDQGQMRQSSRVGVCFSAPCESLFDLGELNRDGPRLLALRGRLLRVHHPDEPNGTRPFIGL